MYVHSYLYLETKIHSKSLHSSSIIVMFHSYISSIYIATTIHIESHLNFTAEHKVQHTYNIK